MSEKLTDRQRDMLRLVQRSPDIGDGWRQVSEMLWPLVTSSGHTELLEKDAENLRVRFTQEGKTVVRFAL